LAVRCSAGKPIATSSTGENASTAKPIEHHRQEGRRRTDAWRLSTARWRGTGPRS
jgi:hypothetical protein